MERAQKVGDDGQGQPLTNRGYDDEMVAIVPAGHALLTASEPVSASRFCAEPFVIREIGSGTRDVVERALAAHGSSIEHPVMSLGSTEAIKRAVAAGIGVAIVSRLTLGLELAVGTLAVLPLGGLIIPRPLYIIRRRGKDDSHATRAFLASLHSFDRSPPTVTE